MDPILQQTAQQTARNAVPLSEKALSGLEKMGYRVVPLEQGIIEGHGDYVGGQTLDIEGHGQVYLPENRLGVSDPRSKQFAVPNPLRRRVQQLSDQGGMSNLKTLGTMLSRSTGGAHQFVQNMRSVMYNEQNIHTLPGLAFLRRTFIEADIIEKAAPDLIYWNWIRRSPTDALDVSYVRDLESHASDPLREDPTLMMPGAEFPDILTSLPEARKASLQKHGFQLKFTRDYMLNHNTAFDLVNRALTRARYWFVGMINRDLGIVLTNGYDPAQTGPDAVRVISVSTPWSGAADPLSDLRDMFLLMEDNADGNFSQPTDVWVRPDNHRELNDYITTNFSQPFPWILDPFTKRQVLLVDGVKVHKAPPQSGIPADTAIVLTSPEDDPPVTFYEKNDPQFTTTGELQIRQHMDDKTHDEIFQLWKMWTAILMEPWKVGLMLDL